MSEVGQAVKVPLDVAATLGFDGPLQLGKIATGGELCMEGPHLVRHYLQQAQLHAEFLHGGKHHDTVVSDHVISPEEAAAGVREDLRLAMDALMVSIGQSEVVR